MIESEIQKNEKTLCEEKEKRDKYEVMTSYNHLGGYRCGGKGYTSHVSRVVTSPPLSLTAS